GASGGADSTRTGVGNDTVLGGNAGDSVSAGEGNNVVLGDYGRVVLAAGLLEVIVATDTALGGADAVTSGAGNDRILGGQAGDSINAGDGANIVLADTGQRALHAGVVLRGETQAPTPCGRATGRPGAA